MKIKNPFVLGLVGTLGVGLGLFILASIQSLSTVITYIGAAIFIALGLEPLVALLERHRVPRWACLLIVVIVIFGAAGALIGTLIPVITTQLNLLINQVSDFLKNGTAVSWYTWLEKQFPAGAFDNAVTQLWSQIQKNAGTITGGILQAGIKVVSGFFGFLIIAILTIYFTASMNSMKQGLYQLVPASRRENFASVAEQVTDSVGKYVIGQVSLALVNGVCSAIFLSIIRAPFPILLAVVAFLCSLIPLVGTLSGSCIIVLLTLLLTTPLTAIVAGIYYLIYMQLESYVLSPRIMNRAVKVPGALVVIAALAGGTLLGVLGALIAIPFAASVLLIVRQVVIPHQDKK